MPNGAEPRGVPERPAPDAPEGWRSPRGADRPRRVVVERDGPLLVEGPVEVVTEDGTVVSSERFAVAVCTCRRSRSFPWCDTSHRRRTRGDRARTAERGTPGSAGSAGTTEPAGDATTHTDSAEGSQP